MSEKIDSFVEAHREEILTDLAALVRIPSISQPGSAEPEPFGKECARVLDAALQMAANKGMQTANYGNWYGLATRGNGKYSIGIFAHLDVVEAGDGWIFPPFELTEKDGWLFGRGVGDDKIAAIIGMYVSQALDELNLANHTKLVLYLGCCEEKGMLDIDRYVQEHAQPDFSMVPDFIFPVSVGEQGILKFKLKTASSFDDLEGFQGGLPGARIPLSASVTYKGSQTGKMREAAAASEDISAEVQGEKLLLHAVGHADSKWGANDSTNAIAVLADFLAESGLLSGADQVKMRAIGSMASDKLGKCFDISCSDELFGALRCNCLIAASESGCLTLHFDIRYPINAAGENIVENVIKHTRGVGFEVTDIQNTDPWLYPKEDEKVKILCDCWTDVSGQEAKVKIGGGTYARKLKNAVSYGPKDFKKCGFLPQGHGEIHSPDEARSVETVLNAVKVYIRAVASLDEWHSKQL